VKLYVASSWRNARQPAVVEALRGAGHEVYDFRNPAPDDHGFSWREIDGGWQSWTPTQFRLALEHEAAHRGFELDYGGMRWADAFVLVLTSRAAGDIVFTLPDLLSAADRMARGGCAR
jgi:hypothetical protein